MAKVSVQKAKIYHPKKAVVKPVSVKNKNINNV